MTSPQPAADLAVIAAYQAQTRALRARLDVLVTRVWRSLGTYRRPQMQRFVKDVTTLVLAGQTQMSALTVGYMTAQRNAILGRSVTFRVNPRDVTGANARNGTDPRMVYERPFHLVWRQLHDQPHVAGAVNAAIQSGLDRAVELAMTDLQLAKVQTAAAAGSQDKLARWSERVLEGPHSCGLCIVASTQRYRAGELLPIHGGCDCSQRTVYGEIAPPQVLDPTKLADIHDRIEQAFGASSSSARVIPGARDARNKLIRYRDVLVVHEHGELGSVLAVKGRPFLGPGDLAA